MLNKSTSRSEYVVQSGVTPYPIGFAFQYNGDDTPQIRVTIGDMVAEENVHFVISEDLLTINLIPLEEEAPVDPNDYSWMDKWVGMPLVIERDVPFVQESDYQLGRISPERIEKDFDLSVMRDQILADKIDTLHSRIDFVQEEHSLDMAAVDEAMAAKATKTELETAKTTLSAGLERNAQAIQKTRDDMDEEDGRLRAQIIANAAAITAQAAEIATKQDQLTAGDNIVIKGNVISATGAGGGAGFNTLVVQELPATGQVGTIYLVPKDGAAPDVHDEYAWIDATQTFELIGTTQVDLTDYVKKTDYAKQDKAGVITVSTSSGTKTNAFGHLQASNMYLIEYENAFDWAFIGKGTLENIKYDLVKRSITTNDITLTDEEKAAAQSWLGVESGSLIIRRL